MQLIPHNLKEDVPAGPSHSCSLAESRDRRSCICIKYGAGPAVVSVDSNVFIYSLICDIDFIMVISDHYLDTQVSLYLGISARADAAWRTRPDGFDN